MPGYFVRMSIQWLLSMRHAKDKSVTVVSGDPYDRCPYQHGASCHNNCKKLKVEKLSNSRRYGFILIGRNTIIQSPNSSAALGANHPYSFLCPLSQVNNRYICFHFHCSSPHLCPISVARLNRHFANGN